MHQQIARVGAVALTLIEVRNTRHRVLQVCTRRVEVTPLMAAHGASIDAQVATVLLAKQHAFAALQERRGEAALSDPARAAMRARIGAACQGVARALGSQQTPPRRGLFGLFGGREVFALPRALLPVAEVLYHLQRGAMLGEVVGHADERLHLLQLCVAADLPLAAALVAPSVYQVCRCVHAACFMQCKISHHGAEQSTCSMCYPFSPQSFDSKLCTPGLDCADVCLQC